jgi:hypothetical protein
VSPPVTPRVFAAPQLLAHARREFPSGGSADGTPSYELFCSGPLQAATWVCERGFGSTPEAIEGTGLRSVIQFSKFFGPLVFFARETGDTIELVDFARDPNFWEDIARDPAD